LGSCGKEISTSNESVTAIEINIGNQIYNKHGEDADDDVVSILVLNLDNEPVSALVCRLIEDDILTGLTDVEGTCSFTTEEGTYSLELFNNDVIVPISAFTVIDDQVTVFIE